MKGLKIVTIGGGSSYTPELIEGFINRIKELPVREICLVDIEEGKEKLDIITNLARRMIKAANVPIEITATLDRKKALENADFVTTQFRVGQLEARSKDEHIPLKYKMIGQETNGAGGLFKALRTIPVILDICKDIEEICPEAWLINFTNPAGLITQAVFKYTNINKIIGVCNGPINIKKNIVNLLNAKEKDIYVEFIGLNHMVFAKKVYQKGEDVTDKVVKLATNKINQNYLKNIEHVDWDPEFLKQLNMLPIGYVRYYWQKDLMLREQLEQLNQTGKTRADIVKDIEKELFEIYKLKSTVKKPRQLEERGGAYYSEVAVELINSIYNDKRDIHTVNTLNQGAVSGLANDEVVEVNCVITKQGPIPLVTGELPLSIRGIVNQIKSFELLTVDAAIYKDYNKALLALITNPLSDNDYKSQKVFNELLAAHKNYLE